MAKNRYPFRFPDEEIKHQFKICAAIENKSINELLGEIVVRYLKETKEA